MIRSRDRFNTNDPNLCPALRWKRQFILAELDPSVPRSNDGLFWCMHTQTCIGPDGEVAEPATCSSRSRGCHGTGKCQPEMGREHLPSSSALADNKKRLS
jgi:hypothetical protein